MSASSVQFTGERFLPECEGEIWAEHWHRYLFARQFVAGKKVLDAASGEGYGSAWLASSAASVVGLDIHRPTVEAARLRYRASNLTFEVGSVTAMPFADASFDCVVSFETLEHLEEQEQMLGEIRRVLRPDGFVLISTPNRTEYTERRDFHNEFHVLELNEDEFHALLGKRFPVQRWFGQKLLFNSAIWPLPPATPNDIDWIALEDRSLSMPEPMYFIACAAASEECIPSLSRLTLLADPAEAMYREYEQTVLRVAALEETVLERDAQLTQLAERSGRLEKLALDRAAIVEERDRQLAAHSTRAERMEALIVERESVIARRDVEAAAREHALGERDRLIVERDRQLEEVNARASELERLLLDRERLVAERDDQLGAINERVAFVEALVVARDKLLVDTNARIETAEKLLAHRESIVVERDAQLAAANERLAYAESLVAERDAKVEALAVQAAEGERLASRVAALEQERVRLLVEISRRAGVRWWMSLPYRRLRALSDPSVLAPKADEA